MVPKEPRQSQDQRQSVSVSQAEHGLTDEVACEFYLSRQLALALGERQAREVGGNKVKILIFKGKTVKVYCPYQSGDKCTNDENNLKGKPCYILDVADYQPEA